MPLDNRSKSMPSRQPRQVVRSVFAQAGEIVSWPAAVKRKSAFKIEVRFLGGLNDSQEDAFKQAAQRWSNVIVGDIPSVNVDGEGIDDIVILAEGIRIDQANGILGQAGPTLLRPKAAGTHAFLPARGEMSFDIADLTVLESDGSLVDVIAHEMGHVLGIGTIWARKRLLKAATSANPSFNGKLAKAEYGKLLDTRPQAVPVENVGGPGTRNSHWREAIFGNELMSGYVTAANNPMSAVTVASLADLGYAVDMSKAEVYHLPTTADRLTPELVHAWHKPIRPSSPVVLPDSALV